MTVLSWYAIIREEADLTPFEKGSALTIGSFDGPHVGHKAIFERLISSAKRLGVPAVVVTFATPLPAIKRSGDYLGDIATLKQRLAAYEKMGFDFALVINFSYEFSKIKGRAFLDILQSKFNMRYIVEGVDFHFGANGSCGVDTIKGWAANKAIDVESVGFVRSKDGKRVSSSLIRSYIANGQTQKANELLCEPYKKSETQSGQVLEGSAKSSLAQNTQV